MKKKLLTVPLEASLKRELDKLRQEGFTINGWVRVALTKALRAHRRERREAKAE